MPAQGGHVYSAGRELLGCNRLGFSFCSWLGFCFLGGSCFSFCFFSGFSFFLLGGFCSSFFFFAHGGWLVFVCHFFWFGFRLHFCLGSWGCSSRCCSGWRSHCTRCSRLGGRCLCESTSSEETSDQGSKNFVHLDFPKIVLLEKLPRKFRRHYRNEGRLQSVDSQAIFLCFPLKTSCLGIKQRSAAYGFLFGWHFLGLVVYKK